MTNEDKAQAQRNRFRLMKLVEEHFARDNIAVANAIKEQTRQDVSVRSIQTWLIDPARKSHRALPEWALQALEQYIVRPDKQESLQLIRRQAELRRAQPYRFDYADEVLSNRSVEMATNEVEGEERENSKWCEQFGTGSGMMLAQRFRALEREVYSMSDALGAITRAAHICDNFDEFRRHVDDSIRDSSLRKFAVRETRELYVKGAGEFSNTEGLPAVRATADDL